MESIIKNIPNSITIVRFLLAAFFPILLNLQLNGDNGNAYMIPVLTVFVIICVSDFLDGRIARKIKAVSALGAVLDVTADLIYIVFAFMVLNILKIIPLWFTGLILLKFVEFQVTSYVMRSCNKTIRATFVFDFFGRVSALMFYIIPGIVSILYGCIGTESNWVISMVLYITTLISLISFANRCLNCYRAVNLKNQMIKV